MKDLGPAQKILGITIVRNRNKRKFWLTQHDYILKALDRFNMKSVKPTSIPLGAHLDLTNTTHLSSPSFEV